MKFLNATTSSTPAVDIDKVFIGFRCEEYCDCKGFKCFIFST